MTSPTEELSQKNSMDICVSSSHPPSQLSVNHSNGSGPPQIAEPPESLQNNYLSYEHLPKPKALKVMRGDKENVQRFPDTMLLTIDTSNCRDRESLEETFTDCLEDTQLCQSVYCHSEHSAFHPLLPAVRGRWEPLRSCSANQLVTSFSEGEVNSLTSNKDADHSIMKQLQQTNGHRLRLDTLSSINERNLSSANTFVQRPLSASSESGFYLRDQSQSPRFSCSELLVNRPRNPTPLTAAGIDHGILMRKCNNSWRLRVLHRSNKRHVLGSHGPYLRRLSSCCMYAEASGFSPSASSLLLSTHIVRRKCHHHSKERDNDNQSRGLFLSSARQYLVGLPDMTDSTCDVNCRVMNHLYSLSSKIPGFLLKDESSPCSSPFLLVKGLRSQSCIPFPIDHDVHSQEEAVIISRDVSCGSRPVKGSLAETWSYPELDVNQIERN